MKMKERKRNAEKKLAELKSLMRPDGTIPDEKGRLLEQVKNVTAEENAIKRQTEELGKECEHLRTDIKQVWPCGALYAFPSCVPSCVPHVARPL